MSDEKPIVQEETAQARRIIVKYEVTLNVGNYSSVKGETMMIVDLPADSTPEDATAKAGQIWGELHTEYGEQFRAMLAEPRDNWEGIVKAPNPMQTIITVFKTLFGNVTKK